MCQIFVANLDYFYALLCYDSIVLFVICLWCSDNGGLILSSFMALL